MNKWSTILSLSLGVTFITCLFNQSAFAQKEKRDVTAFTSISFGVSGDLYLKQGNTHSLELEGDDLEDLETEVSGGKLRIKYRRNNWNWNRDRVTVYVTIKDLKGLSVSGSGKVIGEGTFETDDLDLGVSGSGDLDLDVKAGSIDSSISGSGDIELSGRSGSHEISISGSGKLRAEELIVDDYKIRISGSGSCRINATREIDASVSGSGSIYYRGEPDKVYSHASGSGKIRKLD